MVSQRPKIVLGFSLSLFSLLIIGKFAWPRFKQWKYFNYLLAHLQTPDLGILPRSSSSPTSTHRIEKGGCKCANPSKGGHEHDVTNFRNALRSALVKSFSRMSHSQTITFEGFIFFSKMYHSLEKISGNKLWNEPLCFPWNPPK